MEKELTKIKEYFSHQPIERAWLFGSFARGEANSESDIDILVNFSEKKRIGMEFLRIISDLENMLNRHVDLVEEKTLLPWIKPYVDKDKILIYEREA